MTTRIIYHDFQKNESLENRTAGVLTARVLKKGRRWHRFWDNLNRVLTTTCLAMCGVGIAFSLYVIVAVL